jgi:hypothetical protein
MPDRVFIRQEGEHRPGLLRKACKPDKNRDQEEGIYIRYPGEFLGQLS